MQPPPCTRAIGELAAKLRVSERAARLVVESDVVDLHVDSYLWTRLFGYDLSASHSQGLLGARFARQADLPRLREGHVTGSVFIITTNPLRGQTGQVRALARNLVRLQELLATESAKAQPVASLDQYRAAREAGFHAAFIGIQGGHAFADPRAFSLPGLESLLLVTLVHLTPNRLGATSTPIPLCTDSGLTELGRRAVYELEQRQILVDLAHASPRTFADVLAVHQRDRPLIVSHTGLSAVTPHWRNIDDQQLRAIADTGGLVGILFHGSFLGESWLGGTAQGVARHIAHALSVVGPSHVALGSDWDGFISTPRDMPTCEMLPVLVEELLTLSVPEAEVRALLGQSFLQLVGRSRLTQPSLDVARGGTRTLESHPRSTHTPQCQEGSKSAVPEH